MVEKTLVLDGNIILSFIDFDTKYSNEQPWDKRLTKNQYEETEY
jgi:hypothetical protein